METENYYQKNLETDKLNIHTTKKFYQALDGPQKNIFKKFCLWSRPQDCWVSKGKADNCYYLKEQLKELGFVETEAIGEKISFQEKVDREKERAEHRVVNAERRSQKAAEQSNSLYEKAREMAEVIPFGQPIHIGHHSEKRDRNYRDKIHNTYGKAFKEADKADYYTDKAETAKFTAEGEKYSNPKYLFNRIKESEKYIRVCQRRLGGQYNPGSSIVPISEKSKEFYTNKIAEENEKLAFYVKCMKQINPDWEPKAEKATRKKKGQGI